VQQISHDRVFSGPDVSSVRVICDIETNSRDHLTELINALNSHGIPVRPPS
jgi:threonine dehydratase